MGSAAKFIQHREAGIRFQRRVQQVSGSPDAFQEFVVLLALSGKEVVLGAYPQQLVFSNIKMSKATATD